ncbi:MAG: cupredoxin domain-containing protein [Solirubrobacterales bacterium]
MKKIAVLALALGAVLAAPAAAANPAQTSASKTVSIVDFAFRPGTLTVAKGTKVEWVNSSGTTHTVTRAKGFNSGRLPSGEDFSVRFQKTGTFAYHCNIHPTMKGKIVVQ